MGHLTTDLARLGVSQALDMWEALGPERVFEAELRNLSSLPDSDTRS